MFNINETFSTCLRETHVSCHLPIINFYCKKYSDFEMQGSSNFPIHVITIITVITGYYYCNCRSVGKVFIEEFKVFFYRKSNDF